MTTAPQDMTLEELEAALAAKKADPVVIDVNEDGSTTVSESTDIAKPDAPPPWAHQVIEFYGDKLEVRKPTEQALAGFSLASGKYVPQKLQNDLVSLFVKQHMSEKSLERVFFRLLDPEDKDYTPKTIGELMREIALLE